MSPAAKSQKADLRDALIEAIAEYIVNNAAMKSIYLEMGKPEGKEWAKIVNLVGGRGWPTQEEAVAALRNRLLGE